MKKFGIRTEGTEEGLENVIKSYLQQLSKKDKFRYYEIGVAGATTLRAVYEIVKENTPTTDWLVTGIDLPSILNNERASIFKNFKEEEIELFISGFSNQFKFPFPFCRYVFEENPREYSKNNLTSNSLDIVLIDGCHGRQCVIDDFLSIEAKVKPGGLVIFHDACAASQNTDYQDHCRENINVRKALVELGLLSLGRNGWAHAGSIPGSRLWGGEGNGFEFFRKVTS